MEMEQHNEEELLISATNPHDVINTADLTKFVVKNVGKCLAVLYCVGLIVVIIYHCYFAPRSHSSASRFRCRLGSEPRAYKDAPPSYDSIHFSELPPHYDELIGYQAAAAAEKPCRSCSLV